MSSPYLLTENSHEVAVQLADRWSTAVEAQAGRIRQPDNARVTVPDQWRQVIALRQVLEAAEMARKHAPAHLRQQIDSAITRFIKTLVRAHGQGMNQRDSLVLARDVLEHFDEYWCGTGREQKVAMDRNNNLTREELAIRYRPDFGTTTDSLPTLRLGDPYPAGAVLQVEVTAPSFRCPRWPAHPALATSRACRTGSVDA